MKQRSPEWFAARRGIITCSKLSAVLGLSRAYARDIILERTEGELPLKTGDEWAGTATDWGIKTEPAARAAYELRYNCTVHEVGFLVSRDRDYMGGSADGLVGRWGGVEIKCPEETAYHTMNWARGMDPDHMAQIQGLMHVYQKPWFDFISYDPRVRATKQLYVERIKRDDKYIQTLLERVDTLWEIVLSGDAGKPEPSLTDNVPSLF